MARSESRGRQAYRTPSTNRNNKRKKYTSEPGSRSTVAMLIDLADSLSRSPIAQKVASKVGGKILEYGANRIFSKPSTRTKSKRKGYSGSSALGGKVKPRIRNSKRIKGKNGKFTPYGLEMKGITLSYEKRITLNTAQSEAVAVGHTSLPAKVCAINMWRAVLKHLYIKLGMCLPDYSSLMTSLNFQLLDVINVIYYANGQDVGPLVTVSTYTIDAIATFDGVAAFFAAVFDDVNLAGARLHRIQYIPVAANKFHKQIEINLVNMKVAVATKSILKIQNITVETAEDDQADDITSVVLQGKIYKCKGNNFVRKSNGKMLDQMFGTFNEEALYGAWIAQASTQLGGTSVGFYGNVNSDIDSTMIKPAEVPKPWEIKNCIKHSPITIGPGLIKTSVLTNNFEMSLQAYFHLLYSGPVTSNVNIIYEPKLGYCQVMYLEKVIGRLTTAANNIKLWAELDFRQSVYCYGYEQQYTAPISYQTNF